ncbi:hypothetical protein H0178_52250 [Cytobacillus firmus]|uniref:hypothetical protein n=1 Tax=Paenibacillus lautus TaxID=1401 RepID=UPI00384BC538|nr:hypothetical protein [Cytobacillus firmus]
MKRLFTISTWVVIVTYLLLLMIGWFRGTLSIRGIIFMSVITILIIAILYGLTKLVRYLDRKLYKELKRMMK